MFRLSYNTVNLLNSSLKLCKTGQRGRKTFIQFVPQFTQAKFYSKDAREVKSPLATLIQQQQQEQKQQTNPVDEDNEKQKNKEKSWRQMKYTLIFVTVSFACGGVYLITQLGTPRIDENGEVVVDQFSSMSLIKQYFLRTLHELNYYGQLIKEPSREKLLPDVVTHPMYQYPKYTLVLEFTDVIVHPDWTYQTGWRFKKRPGLDNFLESLRGVYEVVVYTAEQGVTVFPIIDALDPRGLINYKLFRDATLFIDGKHVKDLDKLNRDLTKVIVIDWNDDCTKMHRENVLKVPRWGGNDDDTDLLTLSSFLLAISQSEIDDVREVLKVYHEFDNPLDAYKERQKKLIEQAEADAEHERDKSIAQSPINRWRPSFLKKNF